MHYSVVHVTTLRQSLALLSREVRRFQITLARNHPILTPTQENWLESGEILAKIRADQGFEPHKLRDLHFDVLIALTARSHGARLITSNRKDFELISRYREFRLEVW
jgi:predicted nucleic acid-binding protein